MKYWRQALRGSVFLLPALILFVDFLGPVLVASRSFVRSDFSVQHWPWAQYLYEELRAGRFPFWTQSMAGGFPLAAEGQVAAFYGLHRILFACLPFWIAYSSSIAMHFIAGTLGFYGFCRAVRLSRPGAGLAALVYAFGSNYAGCFYNTGSLRVLAWLPFLLWALESMREKSRAFRGVLGLCGALIVSQMWNAGFSQIALYAVGFGFCFALLNLRRRGGVETLAVYTAAAVLGTLLSAPQMLLTMELIGHSVRQSESVAFALWGSVPPTAMVGLLFPEWGNIQRVPFYAGVPALLMAAAYVLLPRARRDWRPLMVFGFFLLLSFGKLNPVYVALVKGLNLTLIRNPAKFLFFAGWGLAWMAGLGLDALLLALKRGRAGKIAPLAVSLGAAGLLLPAVCQRVWSAMRPWWETWSARYLQNLLMEKGASAKPPEHYRQMLDAFYEQLGCLFTYQHTHTGVAAILALATGLWVWLAVRGKLSRRVFLAFFLFLAAADFHYFGWHLSTGFVGNVGPVSETRPDSRILYLREISRPDPGGFAEFVVDPAREFLPPNRMMAYGLSHVGGYSPLLLKNYYDLTYDLGFMDGSTGRAAFSEEVWRRNQSVLSLIGLKFLATDAPLQRDGFRALEPVGGSYFYRNTLVLSGAGAWTSERVIPEAADRLAYLKSAAYQPLSEVVTEKRILGPSDGPAKQIYSNAEVMQEAPGKFKAFYTLPAPGVGWARITAYPGWRLKVDGRAQEWFTVNHAFIGFKLEAGEHTAELTYIPTGLRKAQLLSALGALLTAFAAFHFFLRAKPL